MLKERRMKMIVVQFVDGQTFPLYSAELDECENAALWTKVKSEGLLRVKTDRSDLIQIRSMKEEESFHMEALLKTTLSQASQKNNCA